MTTAAFFDLDRTLLLGASGPTISAALRAHGLLPDKSIPGEKALFAFFNVFGETLPSILLTRQGARAAKGWLLEDVKLAANDLAEPLAAAVEPFAVQAMAKHASKGAKLVLATTTPFDLVEPFAELIGFDAVLATRYRVDATTGRYDGTIDGEFVWAQGKSRSVVAWARANSVELADSFAYSDSFFDVPMLSKVGNPIAVNPDPRLFAFATAKGWPLRWFNAPEGVPKPVGVEPQAVIRKMAQPELLPWVKIDVQGADRLPAEGGALLAANHRSYLDPLLMAYTTGQSGRPVRFLAKKELTDTPVIGPITKSLGAIRVDRGSGSKEPMIAAADCLAGGELVAVFPQGTIPRGLDFFEPTLHGRHGTVRLAIENETMIVPIGIWGTEKVWPRSNKLPYLLNLANPPTVTVMIGEPYLPSSSDLDAATDELMAKISALLPAEAREKRVPSERELALTYPSSHSE